MFVKTVINEKEAGVGPFFFKKKQLRTSTKLFTFLLKRRQFLAIDIQEKIDLANLPFFKALVMGSD